MDTIDKIDPVMVELASFSEQLSKLKKYNEERINRCVVKGDNIQNVVKCLTYLLKEL